MRTSQRDGGGSSVPSAAQIVDDLGRVEALQLLALLELPDVDRHRLMSTMFVEDDGRELAELVARIERDTTGATRERIVGDLHAALEGDGPV